MKLDASQLLTFIQNDLQGSADLTVDTALFSSGELDSMSMIQLIAHIENTSGLRVEPEDVTLENFDTVAAMLRYVQAQG